MQQLRATNKSLTFPPLSIARYSFTQLSQQGRQWREGKCPTFQTVAKGDSNLGSLDCESGILPLSYRAPLPLCVLFRPCDQKKALHELQHCLNDVHSWLRENRLLLNGSKTKMITFGTKQRLTVATNIHVTVDGCLIYPYATTKNLGIVYDSTLSMEHQVNAVCRVAYLRFFTQYATKTLIQAFVISKLDCGNALLSGVSTNLLRKLQRVQNIAARVITFTLVENKYSQFSGVYTGCLSTAGLNSRYFCSFISACTTSLQST